MRVSALFSGGKDSTYAVYLAQQQGWDVESLLTIFAEAEDSYMFHHPNIEWTPLQAEAMGIEIKTRSSRGEKEKELEDLEELMRGEDVDGFLSGAIASDYQWSRLNRICQDLGRPLYSMLWRKDQVLLLEDMVDAGFQFMIVGVYAYGFDESWLGRIVNRGSIEELKVLRDRYRISPSGEGGEIETFVLDGPNFLRTIHVDEAEVDWARDSGTYRIKKASLEQKMHT